MPVDEDWDDGSGLRELIYLYYLDASLMDPVQRTQPKAQPVGKPILTIVTTGPYSKIPRYGNKPPGLFNIYHETRGKNSDPKPDTANDEDLDDTAYDSEGLLIFHSPGFEYDTDDEPYGDFGAPVSEKRAPRHGNVQFGATERLTYAEEIAPQ